MKKQPRPKLYFKHEDVLDTTLLEPNTMSMYLHQNMPAFFGDIGDLADCLDTFSHQDEQRSRLNYSFAMQQEIYDFEKLGCLICARAVTETNLHCLEAKQANQTAGAKGGFYQFVQPYHFEHLRTYR